jgi:hypothetical protein
MDEDAMEQALVRGLRARGVDVLTAEDAGMMHRDDPDHLAYAAAEGRVLCTFNVGDFWALHSKYLTAGRTHAGIVLMPQQRYGVGEQLRRLLHLAVALSPDDMINGAEFLNDWAPRV